MKVFVSNCLVTTDMLFFFFFKLPKQSEISDRPFQRVILKKHRLEFKPLDSLYRIRETSFQS